MGPQEFSWCMRIIANLPEKRTLSTVVGKGECDLSNPRLRAGPPGKVEYVCSMWLWVKNTE